MVTGAGRGIGEGIAEVFVEKGYSVVIAEIDRITGQRVTDRLGKGTDKAIFEHVDVTSDESVASMVTRVKEIYGRLDVLVNNAGTNVFVDPLEATDDDWDRCMELEATDDDWDRCMELDLKSLWRTVKYAAPMLTSGGGGAVVNIASTHAFQTSPGSFPYPAAKAGVVGLTRILALDLASRGIRVNAVCPGWIDTPLAKAYFNDQADPVAARKAVIDKHPVKRLGTPLDVGHAVAFLASPEAGFITGTTLMVDGGMTAQNT